MKNHLLIQLVILLLLNSFQTQGQNNSDEIMIAKYDPTNSNSKMSIRNIDRTLTGKEISISSFLYKPFQIVLTKGNLIIHDRVEKDMLKIFSYPDIEFLFSWGKKGKGPNELEIISSLIAIDTVFSFIDANTLKKFRVDSSKNVSLVGSTELFNQGIRNGFNILEDSLFITNSFEGEYENKEHLFLFPNAKRGEYFGNLPDEGLSFDFYQQKMAHYSKSNVVNRNEKKIMTFYNRLDRIKIYDFGGILLNEIQIDIEKRKKKITYPNDWLTFAVAHGTKNYVYTLLINDSITKITADFKNFKPEIFVWNWNGELLKRYILDKPILDFAVSEEFNKIYAIDLDGGNKIIEFNLPIIEN